MNVVFILLLFLMIICFLFTFSTSLCCCCFFIASFIYYFFYLLECMCVLCMDRGLFIGHFFYSLKLLLRSWVRGTAVSEVCFIVFSKKMTLMTSVLLLVFFCVCFGTTLVHFTMDGWMSKSLTANSSLLTLTPRGRKRRDRVRT